MKQAMINYSRAAVKNDVLYTPAHAVTPLLRYIPRSHFGGAIWEPCDAGAPPSKICEVLEADGRTVVSTDIRTGTDFLTADPPAGVTAIITNPPYSLKDRFIARCYAIGLPWALLMPLTALEGKRRGDLFRRYGVDVVVLDGRVNFMTDKKGTWFNTSWFLWYPGQPMSAVYFERLEVPGK